MSVLTKSEFDKMVISKNQMVIKRIPISHGVLALPENTLNDVSYECEIVAFSPYGYDEEHFGYGKIGTSLALVHPNRGLEFNVINGTEVTEYFFLHCADVLALVYPDLIHPCKDRILLLSDDAQETVGSLVIPEASRDTPQTATVLAVGDGCPGFPVPNLFAGDRVMVGMYDGVQFVYQGKKMRMVRFDEILGKFSQ